MSIGVAAHITAASPGGPRYSSSTNSKGRRSISNGIWLCQDCAKLIDSDELRYPVEVLQTWKAEAEANTRDSLSVLGNSGAPGHRPKHLSIFDFRSPARDWYVHRPEEAFVHDLLFSDKVRIPNVIVTGRTGVGKSSFLNWLAASAERRGMTVVTCVPYSDRAIDLLSVLLQHGLKALDTMQIRHPPLAGIPKLDLHSVYKLLGEKSKKRVLIVIDQVERLFPPAVVSGSAILATWNSVLEAIGDLVGNPKMLWVLAVKEWYYLALFPTAMHLRLNNFTYVTLADLEHNTGLVLVQTLSRLSGMHISREAADLLVTKTGGSPIRLVLAFILAADRSPRQQQIAYDYLSETAPWNDIFDADYCALESAVQKHIVLAMAHSGREVVAEERVIDKVSKVDACPREAVLEEIRKLDHDKGIVLRNEHFLSFVHSGFGIFLDRKYAGQYPKSWEDERLLLRAEQLREESLAESNALRSAMAMVAHRLANILPVGELRVRALQDDLRMGKTERASEHAEAIAATVKRAMETIVGMRSLYKRPSVDPNAFTDLGLVLKTAVRDITRVDASMQVAIRGDETLGDGWPRVAGEEALYTNVFTELLQNARLFAGVTPVRVAIQVRRDKLTGDVLCDVEDNGRGIHPTVRDKLFEPFFSTSSNGTGLGLAVVRRMMERYGGRVEEIGEPGKGACFRLHFRSFEGAEHPEKATGE